MSKVQISQHDQNDDEMKENPDDYIEPEPISQDTRANFNMKIKKQTIIQKERKMSYLGANLMLRTQSFNKSESKWGQSNLTKKLIAKGQAHLKDKGENLKPYILPKEEQQEEEYEVYLFRKKKEREEQTLNEEIKQKVQAQKKIRESEILKSQEGEKLQNKNFTYDYNGEIMLVKDVIPELLPNPIMTPSIKVAEIKQKKNRNSILETVSSTNDDYQMTQQSSNHAMQEHHKTLERKMSLIKKSSLFENPNSPTKKSTNARKSTMFQHPVTNIVNPMGSVFELIKPSEGITVSEQGKLKVGSQSMSRKQLGQMTLDEYKQTTSKFNLPINKSRIDEDTPKHLEQSINVGYLSPLNLTPQVNKLKVSQSQSQLPKDYVKPFEYQESKILEISNFNLNLTAIGFLKEKPSLDRVFIPHRKSLNTLMQKIPQYQNEPPSENTSYIDPLIKPQKKSFKLPTINNLSQTARQGGFYSQRNSFENQQLSTSRSRFVSNNNSRQLEPISQDDDEIESQYGLKAFQNKNRQILQDRNWGTGGPLSSSGNNNRSQMIKMERKPIAMLKSNRETKKFINKAAQKQRPYIEKVMEKSHLPPPPYGKTLGHGFGQISLNRNLEQALSQI